MEANEKQQTYKSLYLSPLIAGSVAGVTVVTALYPLDTLKTRLQAAQGLKMAGGFRGVYKVLLLWLAALYIIVFVCSIVVDGSVPNCEKIHKIWLLIVLSGSVPINSLFFVSYEATKSFCEPLVAPRYVPAVHMFAASLCEVLTCLIGVPTEIVKQRKQTYVGTKSKSALAILGDAYRKEGIRRGVYRGFTSTVLRDLPFNVIELPIWELLKTMVRNHNDGQVTSFQSGLCGAVAGGFAAAVTTPLDLVKTRIMLAESPSLRPSHAEHPGPLAQRRIGAVLATIYGNKGLRGLFAGVTPRITIVMLGGFLFFGLYEETRKCFEEYVGER